MPTKRSRHLKHPKLAALVAFVHGTLDPPGRIAVTRHLVTDCERCRERMAPWVGAAFAKDFDSLPRARGPAAEYDLPLDRAIRLARHHVKARSRAAAEAAKLLSTAQLPTTLPEPAVRRSHAAAWLDAARALRRENPERHEQGAVYAATLAEACLLSEIPEGAANDGRRHLKRQAREAADLAAKAWGEVGNARRRTGAFIDAEQAFRTAMGYAGRGTGDVELHAILLDLSASLSIDERNFDRADKSLALAGLLYEKSGHEEKVAKALIQRGLVAAYTEKFEIAASFFGRALCRIDREQEPQLFRTAVLNAVGALIDLNELDRAETLLADSRPLIEEIGGAVDQPKLRWVEAKIARAAGRHHQAERAFREIRRGFSDERMPYYVALVNLELCAIWLHARRTEELRAAVGEALATFLGLGIEREALASVILLDQAVQQDRATLEMLTRALREVEGLEGRRLAIRS